MCNDYGNRIPFHAYVEEFSQQRLPLVFPGAEAAPNLEPRDEIWPTDRAPVIRSVPGGVHLEQLAWGLAPATPKSPAIINMRSEGQSFPRGRCLVPASHYYEFTGKGSPKTRWRFTPPGEGWFCFAGLIGRGRTKEGFTPEAFTLLTIDAGPDVAPYHARQPVILHRASWPAWLNGAPAAALLRPSPPGSLQATPAPRPKD